MTTDLLDYAIAKRGRSISNTLQEFRRYPRRPRTLLDAACGDCIGWELDHPEEFRQPSSPKDSIIPWWRNE
jgi:hypothetical protein